MQLSTLKLLVAALPFITFAIANPKPKFLHEIEVEGDKYYYFKYKYESDKKTHRVYIPQDVANDSPWLWLTKKEFLQEYKRIAGGTGAYVFRGDGHTELLTVERGETRVNEPGKWEVPGGGIDDNGELIVEANVRELDEETQQRTILIPYVTPPWEWWKMNKKTGDRDDKMNCDARHLIRGGSNEKDIVLDNKETTDLEYATKEDIEKRKKEDTLAFVNKEGLELYYPAYENMFKLAEAYASQVERLQKLVNKGAFPDPEE